VVHVPEPVMLLPREDYISRLERDELRDPCNNCLGLEDHRLGGAILKVDTQNDVGPLTRFVQMRRT